MANRWGNNGNSDRLYFLALQKSLWTVTAAMKLRCPLPAKKVMTNLDSTLKSRDITLPTKVQTVKAMVFQIVTYAYEPWIIKKAEHQRTDALNCSVREDFRETLGLQRDPISPS